MTNEHTVEKKQQVRPRTILAAFAIVLGVTFAIFTFLSYGQDFGNKGSFTWVFSRGLALPVAIIGWSNWISVNEYNENLEALRKFYSSENFAKLGARVDFSTEDGQKRLKIKEKRLLNKMIEDRVLEILAKKNSVAVSDDEVNRAVKQRLDEYGTRSDVEQDLQEKYGWTLEQFRQKIVRPAMLRQALAAKVLSDPADRQAAQAKIEQARQELLQGKDFAVVAKQYSDGSSAEQGGEIGWIKKEQAIVALQEVLFSEKGPEKNKVYESDLGLHILEVLERKKIGEDEVIKIRQVFVRKKTLADWFNVELAQMTVVVPTKGFVWNKQIGQVEFSDPALREFEKQALEDPKGDAALLF